MTSPQLAIAKVSFSAVLLRPDPTSCSRNEIDEFLQLLDATISRCSPPNVQKCKQWILQNLVQSSTRIAALGKYLMALSKSYTLDIAVSRQAREPSTKRKRLHILYILNDVLYHVHIRDRNSDVADKLEPAIQDLVRTAAAFPNCPKHSKKVTDLVDLWSDKRHFPEPFIQKLRTTIKDAPETAAKGDAPIDNALASGTKSSKEAPFIMPAIHGDASVSWYDLPAANWLPVIEPNSTRPMNPEMIKPLQLTAGPAEESLIRAVQDLLADVDRIYNKDHREIDRSTEDIDQLGQRVVLDEITGNVINGETYYGWSRAFCEKMKQRRKKASSSGNGHRGRSLSRSRSDSRSSSRGSSRPAFKRRRVSSSRSESRSRSRTRSRSPRRSYSRERRRQRSYSRSRSRSPSRDRRYNQSRPQSQGRSPPPPRSYDPPYYAGSNGKQQSGFPNQPPHLNPNPPYQHQAPPFPQSFPPLPMDQNPYAVPPPPPPPQNYQGQWPPPPPPPVTGMPPNMPPNWLQNMAIGGWSSHPSPMPPGGPPQQQGNGFQQYGRGGRGDYRGQGYRGGWDHRGRGW
ncbi:uncharacterized protein GGS22DRAFT_192606 [Annulohypoxylon maeteangense]|uniref:uncharacterized protein n=1 Tax=Annulohypoxylon maeteangense TaxID=1927788 RepID=UPI0020084B84|nr:uncharacterized protein GGS22DRAFT_192606 [Annulohypoxylon maeteangense]KAI0881118.1 hypothetical protein GGS22DRAFT_192606 [Annulohypoxylon maeteangense]